MWGEEMRERREEMAKWKTHARLSVLFMEEIAGNEPGCCETYQSLFLSASFLACICVHRCVCLSVCFKIWLRHLWPQVKEAHDFLWLSVVAVNSHMFDFSMTKPRSTVSRSCIDILVHYSNLRISQFKQPYIFSDLEDLAFLVRKIGSLALTRILDVWTVSGL